MSNTINNITLIQGQRNYTNLFTLRSDGSQETNLLVFDSSVVYAASGLTDTKNASIEKVWFSGSKLSTSGFINLTWDADTDVIALPITFGPTSNAAFFMDYSRFGGLKNYSGTGKTGDLLMTTSGLASPDGFTIVFQMRLA